MLGIPVLVMALSTLAFFIASYWPKRVTTVDGVFTINLASRPDRLQAQAKNFADHGVPSPTRIEAVKDTLHPGRGCLASHVVALKRCQDSQCLIVEDDWVWSLPWSDVEGRVRDATLCLGSWDVLLLSRGFIRDSIPSASTRWDRVLRATSAAAYIVAPRYIPTLMKTFQETLEVWGDDEPFKYRLALDVAWQDLQAKDKWFLTRDPLGRQAPGHSDIEKGFRAYSE